MKYKPQMFVVATNNKPNGTHVAGVYHTYEEAKHAHSFISREEQMHYQRHVYEYDIWQLTIGNTTLPPKIGG